MNADLLREAAGRLRGDEDLPSDFAAALADWIEEEVARFGHLDDDPVFAIICAGALTTARAYLGRSS